MKTNKYSIGTNVQWLDCESNVPYYTIVNATIQKDGRALYYIRHRIQPYGYWVLESRVQFNKKVKKFSKDLNTDPRLKINYKAGCLSSAPNECPSDLYEAWIEMRHAIATIVVILFISILQGLHLK